MGADTEEEPFRLYRLYDADSELLYIGISDTWSRRMAQHHATKLWFPAVRRVDLEPFPSRSAVLDAERHAIERERPLFNVQHGVPSTRARALEYLATLTIGGGPLYDPVAPRSDEEILAGFDDWLVDEPISATVELSANAEALLSRLAAARVRRPSPVLPTARSGWSALEQPDADVPGVNLPGHWSEDADERPRPLSQRGREFLARMAQLRAARDARPAR